MNSLDPNLIFLLIWIGVTFILIVPRIMIRNTRKRLINYQYKKKLKKIEPNLISFDLDKIQKQYFQMVKEYQVLKQDLAIDFNISPDPKQEMTIKKILNEEKSLRKFMKGRTSYSYNRKRTKFK